MAEPTGDHQAGDGPAQDADSPAPSGAAGGGGKAYAHTLSLRLTAEAYRRLRLHARAIEDQTGQRATHQAIIETALAEYLARQGS